MTDLYCMLIWQLLAITVAITVVAMVSVPMSGTYCGHFATLPLVTGSLQEWSTTQWSRAKYLAIVLYGVVLCVTDGILTDPLCGVNETISPTVPAHMFPPNN